MSLLALETLRLDAAALAYLESMERFSPRFLEYLERLPFTGDGIRCS
jgi:nicotinic acid phosphoribosyltransferase